MPLPAVSGPAMVATGPFGLGAVPFGAVAADPAAALAPVAALPPGPPLALCDDAHPIAVTASSTPSVPSAAPRRTQAVVVPIVPQPPRRPPSAPGKFSVRRILPVRPGRRQPPRSLLAAKEATG